MPTLIDKHLAYVDNATVSAQKRQQKLWKAVNGKRTKGGILPLTNEVLDEYIQAVRMTASLMIDIEMVRDEYLAEKSAGSKRKRKVKSKAKPKAASARKKR
jgi:hypothetical protein